MRYHFCLFSALQRVPFIAIERSDKVSDLCWDINWQARVVPQRIEAMELVEHGMRLRQSASTIDEHLKRSVQTMKERALRNLNALNALIYNPPIAAAERSSVPTNL
jgi:polysaccharide pyruvyl transferase WcaK-like protein